MIVVADTSPLNYLVLLGHIDILAKIYAEVLVPQTVLDELQDSDAPAEVRASRPTSPSYISRTKVEGNRYRVDALLTDWGHPRLTRCAVEGAIDSWANTVTPSRVTTGRLLTYSWFEGDRPVTCFDLVCRASPVRGLFRLSRISCRASPGLVAMKGHSFGCLLF